MEEISKADNNVYNFKGYTIILLCIKLNWKYDLLLSYQINSFIYFLTLIEINILILNISNVHN